ncbi:uncharacterized protein LOC128730933 [Anopheles nili]|uniref:uncharacterized protein LOC128730933 n=1 Tax=Anopheles nili TaxID=185578 RepID=UPI00237A833B|nr:uncharacterized protein LOC128730933 [Anopheles nili]
MAHEQNLAQRESFASEMLQHQQLNLKQQPDGEKMDVAESIHMRASVGEKRRYSELMCESDEDDFAGFDEDAASSENGILNSPRPLEYASITASENQLGNKCTADDDDGISELQNTLKQEDLEVSLTGITNESNKAMMKKKSNVLINTQDDIYKIPFKYGWKRELVYRANLDGNSKDKGEVYYITPTGKKLRTRNDIAAILHDDLTINNFTFVKEPVGGKPNEETIRSAKSYSNVPKRPIPGATHAMPLEISSDLGKRIPKPKMPKGASPPPPSSHGKTSTPGQTTSSKTMAINPQVSCKAGHVTSGNVGVLPSSGGQRNNVHGSSSTTKSSENFGMPAKQSKLGGKHNVECCTIQCILAMGMIPQLQCMVCNCMYHPECVNATTAEALARRFTCKSCMEDSMTVEMQQHQSYKESFGKFAVSGNGNSKNDTTKTLFISNNEGSLSSKSLVKSTSSSSKSLLKENTKRNQQLTTKPATVASVPNESVNSTSGYGYPTKDIPPQDVIVIGNHEYVVVPKGKSTVVKQKKFSNKSTNSLSQAPIKIADDSRKLSNNATNSGSNSGKLTNYANDRLSTDDMLRMATCVGSNKNDSSAKTGHINSSRDPSNFLSDVSAGYTCLMLTFDYLKVQELLRACSVCRMWNHLGNHPRFWKTVRMKNSYISDWTGMMAKLHKNGTKHLDLRKVLNVGSNDEIWQSFADHIAQAEQIEIIDLCRCSSAVVGNLLRSNPNLRVVNALAINNDPIDFVNFEHGVHLEELRLKSAAAISLNGDMHQLAALRNLRHLSLTSISKLGGTSIEALGSLNLLQSLELGECTEMGLNLAEILPKLTRLKRLRLEKGQENFDMFAILSGVSRMESLTQLELINCDVKLGFDKHLAICTNIRKLLLIPTYVSQSAATNRMVLKGIIKLHQTLHMVVWAVTVELLRVTELYIDTNVVEETGGSIPILKPVPGIDESGNTSVSQPDLPDEVEIVPLKKVQSILERKVPNTKLQILKIPFVNTWKQTMLDIV